MNEIIQSLQYILPSLVVFASSFFITRGFLKKEEKREKYKAILGNQKEISKIRLQAYERLCIFLERINPESLIIRSNTGQFSNSQMQQILLKAIREEWEHNLSQQLYVSEKTWLLTKNSKENIVKLINTVAIQLKPNNYAMELCTKLLEAHQEETPAPTKKALDNMRDEIQSIMI